MAHFIAHIKMNLLTFPTASLIFLGALILGIECSLFGRSGPRIITNDGNTYNEDDCEKSAGRHTRMCGVIFEKTECDEGLFGTGDELGINEGHWINLRGTGFHEDVESIIVAPGCVLFGYDENNENARGTGISVSAVGRQDWVYRELNSKRFVSVEYIKR